jgi:hypothetical protein
MAEMTYEARHVKRFRSTKAEVDWRRAALLEIVGAMKPMTVRQTYYQASVRNIVEKTEAGYNKVQTDLVHMRRTGEMPYDWLTDYTRWMRKPRSYRGIEEALNDTARFYRKSLWEGVNAYAEIWLEKDALAGVVSPITYLYDVPLMVARGYASLSFLHSAAQNIGALNVPVFIHHFGDYDPSGVNASEKIEQTLREMAPAVDITFNRVAVTLKQLEEWNLPTRPTKSSDSRSKNFGSVSVELDAIAPNGLRALVENAINQHLPQDQLRILKIAEEEERKQLAIFAGGLS